MLTERLEAEAAASFEEACQAVADRSTEAIDDLVLLEKLLALPDDNLLRVLGPHYRRLMAATEEERAVQDAAPGGTRLYPLSESLLNVAANEALSLSGGFAVIESVHLILAMFAFPGCAGDAALQRCGIDWRPLRSLVRRLASPYSDW